MDNLVSYSFSVGEIRCTVVLDGASVIGAERIIKRFPNGTEAQYRAAYAEIGRSLDEADSSMNILVLHLADQVIVVDGGEGGRPTGGDMPAALRQAGINLEAVTIVVITHSHGDHIQGLVTANGDLVFPQARYIISAPELEFWQSRIRSGAVGEDQARIVAQLRQRGLQIIAMDASIAPGVSAVPLPGHTPGHIGILVESAGERLLHLADTVHSPMQFRHPEWSPYFDVDTSHSVPTRRAALARAADEGLLTFLYHLTFPGLGRVRRLESCFRWEPLTASVQSSQP